MPLDLECDIAKKAMEVLHENKDTLIAQYIFHNPDVPISDITLVQENSPRGMIFYVARLSEIKDVKDSIRKDR